MATSWRAIVADSLDWEQAHSSLKSVVAHWPPSLRGRRPKHYAHSAWELVEHIRLAQIDLLEFMTDAKYVAPKWPDDYWPPAPAPPNRAAWDASLKAIRRDGRRLKHFVRTTRVDLTKKIPWGSGQTYLRTILVAMDHTSHHVGQLIAVRQMLGAWPPKKRS